MFVVAAEQPRGRRTVDRTVGPALVVAEIVRTLHGGAHRDVQKVEAGILPAEVKVRTGIGQRSQVGLHLPGVASGCPSRPRIGVAIFEGWTGLTAVDFLVNDGNRIAAAHRANPEKGLENAPPDSFQISRRAHRARRSRLRAS